MSAPPDPEPDPVLQVERRVLVALAKAEADLAWLITLTPSRRVRDLMRVALAAVADLRAALREDAPPAPARERPAADDVDDA